MKLVSFVRDGDASVGVAVGEEVVDLSQAAPSLPRGMCRFLGKGAAALDEARRAVESGEHRLALADIELLAPVPRPRKFFGVGLNYADHAAETGRDAPSFPVIFNKQVSCVNSPGGGILLPRESTALDYEGELAFVVGERCRRVSQADALEKIAGFTIVNDVSVRDWQRRSPTMTLGKSWDSHGPMGPWIVTRDEIGDGSGLQLRTWVNDELRQDSNTRELIFDCATIVETLSTVFTLEPGDVVATGTPDGVGAAMDPPGWLQVGDVVKIEIENIGTLENPVVAD